MKSVIIDSRASSKIKSSLLSEGFMLIEMPTWQKLQVPVSAHPDMLMFIADKKIITHADYLEIAKEQFKAISSHGYELVISNEEISSEYPLDILFNCIELGDFIFGKENNASLHIIDYSKKSEKRFINVKQGYTKCSVAKLNDRAAITADKSLYKAMTSNGIDVLLISEGSVRLDGYDHGFIGGCTGAFSDKLYFMGNLELHPDAEIIKSFCQKHKTSPISLSDEKLFDGGSLYFL